MHTKTNTYSNQRQGESSYLIHFCLLRRLLQDARHGELQLGSAAGVSGRTRRPLVLRGVGGGTMSGDAVGVVVVGGFVSWTMSWVLMLSWGTGTEAVYWGAAVSGYIDGVVCGRAAVSRNADEVV